MSALIGLLLVLVLPTLAGAVLLSVPSGTAGQKVTPDAASARGLACGLATWLLGSGLLARTVGLTATSAWAWDSFVAAVSLLVLLLPRHRTQLGALLGSVVRRIIVVGGLTAVVFAPLGHAIVQTSWSPLGSTPWYYYGLARQVADVGSIPATSLEFGTTTPFLNDYHLFTTGTAMVLLQHPAGPMTVIATITLVAVLLLTLGAVAVSTALGVGRTAALLCVPLAVAAGIAPLRLTAYRPEGLALGMALLLVALCITWLRDRDRRSLVAAALLAATLSQVHGIAALTAGIMVAAAALGSLARGQRAEQLRRIGIALAVLLAGVVVAGLVFREASGTVHAGGLVDRGGLGDPTWEFFRAARGVAPSMPPSNTAMVRQSVRELYDWQRWWIVPVLLLAALGLGLRRRDPVVRRVVLFALVSLVGLMAAASVFMFGWHGYVPRRTGASRMVMEASLLGPPFLATGLEGLAREISARRPGQFLGTRPRRLVRAVAALAALSACGLTTMVRVADYDERFSPSREQLGTWASLPLTSDDVVLANGYTEGFIPDVTGAQGLLDGRAPYTFDDQLHRANGLLRAAHAFFAHPHQRWDFLAKNDVSWVVVGQPGSWALGTGNIWTAPPTAADLSRCPGLARVVEDPTLSVFRVTDPGPRGC